MNKLIAVLVVATLLSGCTLPEAPNNKEEIIVVGSEWTTINGEFVLLDAGLDEFNNTLNESSLYQDGVFRLTFDNMSDSSFIEILQFNYTATHLSFTVDNNTVTFHNYTYEVNGLVCSAKSNICIQSGYLPDTGDFSLHFPDFPFDITINYTVIYREWKGK
jgi:hypothetical protein